MWAINKSPLTIGAVMDKSKTSASSLSILSNKDVIAINQDSLGEQARLIRRFTEEQYDIFSGNLSGSRVVVGIANWSNRGQTISFDFGSVLGIKSAAAYDVWAAKNLGSLSGTQKFTLGGHELRLLILSGITHGGNTGKSNGYINASSAKFSGPAHVTSCSSSQCLPTHNKVSNVIPGASVTLSNVKAISAGTKLVGVDFINYDVALESAWTDGTNTRNMTISVNGGTPKRWAFPISGGDWYDTGRLNIELGGFKAGSGNTIVFAPSGNGNAPDLVGFEVYE